MRARHNRRNHHRPVNIPVARKCEQCDFNSVLSGVSVWSAPNADKHRGSGARAAFRPSPKSVPTMKPEAQRLNGGSHPEVSDEALTERVMLSCTAEMLKRIEDYRFNNRFGSQSGALRALLQSALDADKRRPKTLI